MKVVRVMEMGVHVVGGLVGGECGDGGQVGGRRGGVEIGRLSKNGPNWSKTASAQTVVWRVKGEFGRVRWS